MYSRPNDQHPPPGPPPKVENAPPSLPPLPVNPNANHGAMRSLPPAHLQHAYANSRDNLTPVVTAEDGKIFRLKVEQQPIRARMCGFGDKDRRPITPPPCIRLFVLDGATGKEVDFNEVDSTFYVLNVDLFDVEASHEVNLVRHSSSAPSVSISSSTTSSYPPPPERPQTYMSPVAYDAFGRPLALVQHQAYSAPPTNHGYYPNQPPMTPNTPNYNQYPPPGYNSVPMPMAPPQPNPATGMFTRNLIGSLSVNAFRLSDTDNKVGFWFVLQDLSVRTEGTFRLKMSFVSVAGEQGGNTVNQGHAKILATCFSEPFQVYSAKKFPGVIESTPLSKTFASQGIKIPIRKDGPKTIPNQAEYDADD
ncbi:velvet factor-domain-containing protein [Clohesyomyces aquaticus]|uniref:Velvet factor-domain-containing protein n=1 Tax=Clohesyomyces aquaticus TaxID=1231657 RepID=A0A1Y1ZPG9_9PLEO|nr:velvet factor-domain-containing protein [Clohesyomyces aquaticus]